MGSIDALVARANAGAAILRFSRMGKLQFRGIRGTNCWRRQKFLPARDRGQGVSSSAMTETDAARFQKQAEECRMAAEKAVSPATGRSGFAWPPTGTRGREAWRPLVSHLNQ